MKRFLIILIILVSHIFIYCQNPFPFSYLNYVNIDNDYDGLKSGIPIDIDHDDDVDIIAVNSLNLFWYENDQNISFIKHTISSNIFWGSVFAVDMDSDNDIDIVTSSSSEFEIAWYENDGNQNFTQNTIPSSSMILNCIFTIDIDDDNDIDILTSTYSASMLYLYINDGDSNFTETIIDSTLINAGSVFAIDLDEDNDLDIISATSSYSNSNYLKWYENINDEFLEHELPLGNWQPRSVYCIDFDYDSDVDILLALGDAWNSDKVILYENQGFQNSYNFEEHVLVNEEYCISGLLGITAADYDNDDDIDIIISEVYDLAPQSEYRTIWLCVNDGFGNMTLNCISLCNAGLQLWSIDVDNDTDTDLVSIGYMPSNMNDSRSRIYKNSYITGIGSYELQSISYKLSNHPNPFNPSTTIEFSIQNNSKVELSIHNVKGQKIKTLTQNEFTKGSYSIIWNSDNENNKPVSSGIYYYKLNINGKTEAVKKCLLLK